MVFLYIVYGIFDMAPAFLMTGESKEQEITTLVFFFKVSIAPTDGT